jgi:hypothetical protein
MKAVPSWDANLRMLTFRGKQLKKYKQHPAKNQVAVLSAFQEDGWPDRIDTPIDTDKVNDTVRDLNRSLGDKSPIVFSQDGTGEGITWTVRQA